MRGLCQAALAACTREPASAPDRVHAEALLVRCQQRLLGIHCSQLSMPLVCFWCMFRRCCAALVAVLLLRISRWLVELSLCGRRCRCVATSGWCTLLGRIMRAVLARRRPDGRTLAATAAMDTEAAHAAFWYRHWRRGQQHLERAGGPPRQAQHGAPV
jgi:hypothetical protein